MNGLKITVLQTDLEWENPKANLERLDMQLDAISEQTDVVVLCEMFTTGFSMAPERVAEKHDAHEMRTLNWMRRWSTKLDAVICGSVSVHDAGKYYNRLYWVRPDASFSAYDKRHTFTMAEEDKHYANGQIRIVEAWRGWNICPMICYDLRFPVWSRNVLVDGQPLFDVLIYVANWPEVRREPWKKLLLARAIENQVYVVGCNRVGVDGNGLVYAGDSVFINPKGEQIYTLKPETEEVSTNQISYLELEEFRNKFPVLNDADRFEMG